MTIESAKDKIKTLLEKRGFVEQSMKEGLFTVDTGANKVGVELFGERPITGVFIKNKLEEEGHGIEAVYNLRSQVLAIWDREINRGAVAETKPVPKPELPVKEESKPLNSTVEGLSKEVEKATKPIAHSTQLVDNCDSGSAIILLITD